MRSKLLLSLSLVLGVACVACGTDFQDPYAGGGSAGGSGGSGSTSDPFGAPPTCTSGNYWQAYGDDGSSTMRPGEACISCHASSGGEAPQFSAAGTVFPTGHEPNDCYGAHGGATVVITDANGVDHDLPVNSAGNFSTSAALAFPIHAKVVANGQERAMVAAQATGDCNTCHTQDGANGAPGRIALP